MAQLLDPRDVGHLGALAAAVASAAVVTLGHQVADPLIGLAIIAAIAKITWDSWWTVRGGHAHDRRG